ncbi:MAG: F0F1 ATP synthase subunit delta [Anaerolineae bacterium]|nr:F0F1 ATP synthase subunit delta [Anaerolineae bacterium]
MEFLKPDLQTLVFEIFNFLALAWLLNRFVFKPTMNKVRQRAAEKAEMLQQIEEDRQTAKALQEELVQRLAGIENEVRLAMTKAREDSEAERTVMLRDTQAEVERLLVEAHTDAYRVRKQAMDEFHDELLHTLLHISGSVVAQLATDEMQTDLVKQLTDRVWEMGRTEMRRVENFRQSLGARTPTAHVTTARPLTPDLQGLLARTFSALADRNVNLDIRVDPALAVGIQVRLGDSILDNSVAGQLESLREGVSQTLREHVADE